MAVQLAKCGPANCSVRMPISATMVIAMFSSTPGIVSHRAIARNALTLNTNAQVDRVSSLALGNTYLFSSNLVNSFHVGENRTTIPKVTDDFATWPQLGVNAPFNPASAPRRISAVPMSHPGISYGSHAQVIIALRAASDVRSSKVKSALEPSHLPRGHRGSDSTFCSSCWRSATSFPAHALISGFAP